MSLRRWLPNEMFLFWNNKTNSFRILEQLMLYKDSIYFQKLKIQSMVVPKHSHNTYNPIRWTGVHFIMNNSNVHHDSSSSTVLKSDFSYITTLCDTIHIHWVITHSPEVFAYLQLQNSGVPIMIYFEKNYTKSFWSIFRVSFFSFYCFIHHRPHGETAQTASKMALRKLSFDPLSGWPNPPWPLPNAVQHETQ